MDGEEGGVAASLIIPVGLLWEGGDVEGTAKLTARPSSVSPRRQQSITLPHIGLMDSNLRSCVETTPSPVGD